MAGIAADAVVVGITEAITASVEEATEAAVVEAVSTSVTEAVEDSVSTAITEAISSGIDSAVSDSISESATPAVEAALQKGVAPAVVDVIGSQGLNDIAGAITAIASNVVINQLAKDAIDAIMHLLWVFSDPAFINLTRLIRALRAVEKGGEPPEDDDDDDDDDEEKCRYFEGPEVEDVLEDFIFFTVFGSEACKEGDDVYSMSIQLKKLKALQEDPIGGHSVNQLLQELFVGNVDKEVNLLTGSTRSESDVEGEHLLAGKYPVINKGLKKKVQAFKGHLVPFGNKEIYNVAGSAKDKRSPSWLGAYFVLGYKKCAKCYIASAVPPCDHTKPLQGNIVGGHVWSPALKKQDKALHYYILPICKGHNKRVVYDGNAGSMKTSIDAFAMKITSTNKVPGWKGVASFLTGAEGPALKAARNIDGGKSKSDDGAKEIIQPQQMNSWLLEGVHKIAKKVPGLKGAASFLTGAKAPTLKGADDTDDQKGKGDDGAKEIIQPKQLNDWLLEEVHKVALEFSKDPIDTVFKEVSATVLGKLNPIIKSAGDDATKWTNSEGNDIMLQSLIPFYGIYQAITRLNSLKSDAMGRFHSKAQSALADYKKECLGDTEQTRRKKRLTEETGKVISSKKWKDRVSTFEKTVASKVADLKNN